MKHNADTLLDEIQLLVAAMSRAGDGHDHKNQAVGLLLKCHRLLDAQRDDGFGHHEMPEGVCALYAVSDPQSLKYALNDVARAIEASRFSRMRSSDREFYGLLA